MVKNVNIWTMSRLTHDNWLMNFMIPQLNYHRCLNFFFINTFPCECFHLLVSYNCIIIIIYNFNAWKCIYNDLNVTKSILFHLLHNFCTCNLFCKGWGVKWLMFWGRSLYFFSKEHHATFNFIIDLSNKFYIFFRVELDRKK